MDYRFLFELAIIIFSTKLLGLVMRRIGLPQVVGALIAGILIGPSLIGAVHPSQPLTVMAEIGVILIMFSAGMETNVKDLRECGWQALLVAASGVLLPLIGGFCLSALFHGGFSGVDHDTVLKNVFVGVIMTATSVSITVETLREMGKLQTKAGTIILSAAIIDDIIGIILLSIVISFKNPEVAPIQNIINTALFFVFAIGVGILLHLFFKHMAVRYPHKRRVPIFALVTCLMYAFVAEHFFGVADITGAYIAGIMFAGIKETHYIETKIDSSAYMFFAPVFFASIGIKASFGDTTATIIWFSVCFVVVAILTKMIGCYLASRALKEPRRDSLIVGIGMIARGEVCLIVMQKGITSGLIESNYVTMAIMLVIVSSLLAPILLKFCYGKQKAAALAQSQSFTELPEGFSFPD